MQMTMTKKLCRIRLLNWHYFVNETINISGSCLVTGENTSGKSTILDAIQFVLTTNHRKFNTAANEKSSRDLKGYVRCKTGNEDGTYLRTGSIISYVALEFFEEKTSKYFVLGAKIDSPDEETRPIVKWYREECRLEQLSFITEGRPSTNDDFRKNDKKVQLISQISEAKDRFGQRLGNLEDRFFDMIPKSLAFKPMDNVKDFITKFILPERNIEVGRLRDNIAILKELEDLMEITKNKIGYLENILSKHDDIKLKEREIKVNEILVNKAQLELINETIVNLDREAELYKQKLLNESKRQELLQDELNKERNRKTNLQVALENNENTSLITETRHNIEMLEKDIRHKRDSLKKLLDTLTRITDALSVLSVHNIFVLPKDKITLLGSINNGEEKTQVVLKLKDELPKLKENYGFDKLKASSLLNETRDKKGKLEIEIENLKNKKLTYPDNTVKLKIAIEKEFFNTGVRSDVRIFSDLLQITDHKWQDAVEGYLNTQRFYIIVEPEYYKVALNVYNRIRKEVHTVGLVNTEKLDTSVKAETDSLAYVVNSDNRWALAYSNYLLNRVKRCDDVQSLKEHKVSITSDCMLYQNYAVRKIDSNVYKTPFIGAYAYVKQLQDKTEELNKVNLDIKEYEEKLKVSALILDKLNSVRIDILEENINAPDELNNIEGNLIKEKEELKKAENDPGYIEIKMQIDECDRLIKKKDQEYSGCIGNIREFENKIEHSKQQKENQKEYVKTQEERLNALIEDDTLAAKEGLLKYDEQIKQKSNEKIVSNFMPVIKGLENSRSSYITELVTMQSKYIAKYQSDLGTGLNQVNEYIEEHHKLVSADIIKYEEDLKKAKENCELEFRENFLARLKENIENARIEFRNLNYALKNIYYGEDSYRFELTYNKAKESIYKMITSENNAPGLNLWSGSFESEYKEEMDDLFAKLTAYDDKGEKVLYEYTDYRNYLDYDIEVVKKDGSIQKFSKIYGEKSGGETQTPYYVAIAASFVQLYSHGDTIRIIMFDEAFDKMDDNRISSMMDFLNSQGFQIILATPTNKMEIIGEKVNTILMAMREGTSSYVEVYDL